tara:strand:+ start:4611 stop:4778 length:168 start_codon:yes stop_codon:yes gene_type:complete
MPKRKNNADPVFKEDISKQMKKDKYINPKKVFDYKKSKNPKKKNNKKKIKSKSSY